MKTYIAHCPSNNALDKQSSLGHCLSHAKMCILESPDLAFEIYQARGGESECACIIEVTSEGAREVTKEYRKVKGFVS